jgi:predicted DNA-binding transcriptional regulator YafY
LVYIGLSCQNEKGSVMPRKNDAYASSGDKVIGVYSLLLFSGREYSMGQLAHKFQCSKQTILRVVEQIERSKEMKLGSEIREKERWYWALTPRNRPKISLSIEEIQQLLLCRDIVWHSLPKNMRDDIEKTISKTTVLLTEYEGRNEALRSLAGARPKGVVDYSRSQVQVDAILKALRERCICEVAYHSPERDKPKVLRVAPYQILAYREGLYIRCRMEKALTDPEKYYDPTLALHRMKSVKVTGRKFKAIQVKEEDTGVNGFGLSRGEPFQVVVDVIPKAAMYVRERVWSPDQVITTKKGGGLRLKFTANSRIEVLNWILSFGGEATLVEPKDLREEILKRLEVMRKGHSK